MGENEQGGMLRVVVVLGLIALIASVIIGGVVYAKNNMQNRITGTTSLVDKAIKDNQPAITEADVPKDAWQDYDASKSYEVKKGQHFAIRWDNKAVTFSKNDDGVLDDFDAVNKEAYIYKTNTNASTADTMGSLLLTNTVTASGKLLTNHTDFYDQMRSVYNVDTFDDLVNAETVEIVSEYDLADKLPMPLSEVRFDNVVDWLYSLSQDEVNALPSGFTVALMGLPLQIDLAGLALGEWYYQAPAEGTYDMHVFEVTSVDGLHLDNDYVKDLNEWSPTVNHLMSKLKVDSDPLPQYNLLSESELDSDESFNIYIMFMHKGATNAQIAIW